MEVHYREKNSSVVEDEDADNDERSAGKLRKKKVVAEIAFADAVEQLYRVVDALPSVDEDSYMETRSHNRAKQRFVKIAWDEVSTAIQKEAMTNGLSDELLVAIWGTVSHPALFLSPVYISTLIFSLVPITNEISKEVIQKIIFQIPNLSDRLKLTTLKYLNGVYDYRLCDRAAFESYFCYSAIFFAGRTNELIPWICSLIKKLSTARIVQKSFINDLMDLLHTPINPMSLKAIVDLLRFFKLLRPDLLPNNVFKMSSIGICKKVELHETFRTALFKAKCRFGRSVDPMDTDSEEAEVRHAGNFLQVVNKKCFPEFQIHVPETDPLPNDIARLVKMNKYDIMRNCLKTLETLPIIINDPEVFEHFNLYASLIFQHRFDTYDPKEESRYVFILNRCVQLQTLLQNAIPAVTEWLLIFLPFWDGVLFKRYVFDLFRHIGHTDFLRGYLYVRLKFETLFLYGDPLDRLDVWHTLTTLAMNWMDELHMTGEDRVIDTTESVKESLLLILEFIQNLVIRVATVNGHKDEIFLMKCCKEYIRMHDMMNDIPEQPTYILPPYSLWLMVILCDSLLVMDIFCELIMKIQAVTFVEQSLLHTKYQEILLSWQKQILPDVFRYFGLDPSRTPPFRDLFEVELKERDPVTSELEMGFGGKKTEEQRKALVNGLLKTLRNISAMKSTGFEEIMINPGSRGSDFLTSIDEDKANKFAPNVITLIGELIKDAANQ